MIKYQLQLVSVLMLMLTSSYLHIVFHWTSLGCADELLLHPAEVLDQVGSLSNILTMLTKERILAGSC